MADLTRGPLRLRLQEYGSCSIPRGDLAPDAIDVLRSSYASQVAVSLDPFAEGGDAWKLTSQGYVGYIPVTQDLHLELAPKVPLGNLFGMLEYAYSLGTFDRGRTACETLQEVYERLAAVLAKRVFERTRMGLYREYVPRQERLTMVRGRVDVSRLARSPWEPDLDCRYQDRTADVVENQILTWTLFTILQSGICTDRVLPQLRHAYRQMLQATSLAEQTAQTCERRLYHRLNQDYEPLHALCHFFLANSGPTHRCGNHTMAPFWVDMASLFEAFCAEWLRQHAPPEWAVRTQHRVSLGDERAIVFRIDLVIQDRETGKTLAVLDNKYKTETRADDVQQIIAYGQMQACDVGALIYPLAVDGPGTITSNGMDVHSLTFDIGGDLEDGGHAFLRELRAILP